MRTTRSGFLASYGPIALALALVALVLSAALHAYGGGSVAHEPLAADQVTAELARTVSYGLIDAEKAPVPSTVRRAVGPALAAQASPT